MPHYYGWKPSPPDFRDFQFHAARPVLASLPPAVDLSLPTMPLLDQGALGSCGPNAAAEDILFDLQQQGVADAPLPSRLFIYYCTRKLLGTIGSDSGVDNRTLMKALNQFGWCDERIWPYDVTRYKEQPTQACFDQAAQRQIVEYLAVPQDLNQMRACLAGGDPFLFGFTVYSSFESAQTAATGVVPVPRTSESILGGHDVWFVGYDDQRQAFKFRNSWGQDWGVNGYGWMPYVYALSAKLSGDFWTVKHAVWPAPVPPPPPPPPTGSTTISIGIAGVGTSTVTIPFPPAAVTVTTTPAAARA